MNLWPNWFEYPAIIFGQMYFSWDRFLHKHALKIFGSSWFYFADNLSIKIVNIFFWFIHCQTFSSHWKFFYSHIICKCNYLAGKGSFIKDIQEKSGFMILSLSRVSTRESYGNHHNHPLSKKNLEHPLWISLIQNPDPQ